MSEELTLHEAALRLYDYGPRIEMASTEEELIRLCDERDKLLSFFREADASRASPTPPTTEVREKAMEDAQRIVAWDDGGRLADDEWLVERNETAIIAIARALLSSPRVEDVRREALEEAARAVEKLPQCPFGKGAPPNDLLPTDPCPVCGDLGTTDAETTSKCGDPATIIRLLALSPPDGDGKQEQATRASGPTAPTDLLQTKESYK